jgi:hypothetical protein
LVQLAFATLSSCTWFVFMEFATAVKMEEGTGEPALATLFICVAAAKAPKSAWRCVSVWRDTWLPMSVPRAAIDIRSTPSRAYMIATAPDSRR